jgi:hypothetical protein
MLIHARVLLTSFRVKQKVQEPVTLDLTTKYPPKQRQSTCTTTNTTTTIAPLTAPKPVHIPIEIVIHILEAAYFDINLEQDSQLLANCSRVCRDWTEVAQRLLFRNVTIRSGSSFNAFRAAVDRSTPRGCSKGNAVARLRVVLDHNHPDKLSYENFTEAMRLCPNLYELDLSLYGYGKSGGAGIGNNADSANSTRVTPLFTGAMLGHLRSGPKISALRFSNWSDNDDITCQLLDLWPSLSVVALRGRPPRVPATSTDSASHLLPYRGALREVRLNFQNSPKLDFMKWLLQNSSQSLRVLELEREPASELLEYVVQEHSASLQSLSLPACGSHEQAAAVLQCAQLKEFKVENPWASPSLLRKLPKTLEHIAFGVDKDTPLHVIAETIKTRDEVKAVTAHLWDGEEAQCMLSGLKKVCATKGIELVCTTNIQRFRATVVCTQYS